MPGGRATKLKEAYSIARKNKLDVLTDQPPSPTFLEYREGDRIEFDLKTINPDHKSKIDGVIIKPSMQEQYLCDLVIVEQSSGKRYMFKQNSKRGSNSNNKQETNANFESNSLTSDHDLPGFGINDLTWNCKVWSLQSSMKVSIGRGLLSLITIARETGKKVTHYRAFLAAQDHYLEPVLVSRRHDGVVRVKAGN